MIVFFFSSVKASDNFYIIYTSNVNGMIENCGCGADPLGGIGRVKSFVDKFKDEHNNVLLIDGGDYFNSYPFPKLNDAMYSSLLLMHYDGIIPGDQAFIEGESFFSDYSSKLNEKIVLTNSISDIQKILSKKIGSVEINIYGYLSPYIFDFVPKPDQPVLTNFVEAKPQPAKSGEFQVAVVHGYLSNAQQFAEENPTVSLILLAHDQRKGIWEKNQATIIGNGKDSEYISVIKITRNPGWIITVDQPKINEDLPEDPQIVKIIEAYKGK
jgi:2',3'-cyclic-nucleotide 2'-phosphodiesterase (5'-nucleotidase family)